jgi:hypothetical protein
MGHSPLDIAWVWSPALATSEANLDGFITPEPSEFGLHNGDVDFVKIERAVGKQVLLVCTTQKEPRRLAKSG